MINQLRAKILATGPMTVAQYMKEVLINPVSGYYMHHDVFGQQGDFVTSPEISQIFGEMVGVWCLDQWHIMGQTPSLQLVELGPGRGTLAADMLRIMCKLGFLQQNISLHLVEVSPAMRQMQRKTLCGDHNSPHMTTNSCNTKYGVPVTWYEHPEQVPKGFSCFIAHEFFDALPVHIFQKKDEWREVLVDIDVKSSDRLRMVLSKAPTPASKTLIAENETRQHLEISPESGRLVRELGTRIVEDGGFCLVVDYGHNGDRGDTFRAFKNHKPHDPLLEPGTADLTADVDFSYITRAIADMEVITYGPTEQKRFLSNLGIDVRLKKLLERCSAEEAKDLKSGYHTIMSTMGERFKFFAIYPSVMKAIFGNFPPSGFHPNR